MAKRIIVEFTYNEHDYCNINYYEPTSSGLVSVLPILRHGDTVCFRVKHDDPLGTVVVRFDLSSGCCFTSPGPFTVNSDGNEQTVSDSALGQHYLFSVGSPLPSPDSASPDTAHRDAGRDTAPLKGRGPRWETKTGDLEVVTDPPRD